ncbi:DUF4197 domain-containing protein [Xiashengella succiniciproducens]|jgi:hypothetical protein|uniref:DUF4197 domain-containing protein n=1 Tax=Xiashengella succiniciproducens TaxID=2949635 RepID=A0A9J6ZM13_9BACT|nr:DUF4197 domain-containing protein [Alkaliflexus sp. Ai-910]URW78574.1 DUF4197 domain-containing protein [Alkaliflexus sp. Ai-910]HHT99681.1 DUF4197 domain-containing protein [Bacteroidales bacterium]
MIKKVIAIIISFCVLSSCTELLQVVQTLETNQALTQTEVVSGLKEALRVGSDSAAMKLAKLNGYYGDPAVKLLLPPEAAIITDNISRIPGGEKLVEDLILRINRAAEDAAREAAPVFLNAIRQMTIQDAFTILKGENNAATQYLKANTFNELFNLYQPKLKSSLDKKLVAGVSANETWNNLTGQWNKVAGSMVGQVAGFKKVEVQLDSYLTNKALDGIFLKLAEEEAEIRNDPAARVTEILKRVFGSR